MKDSVLLHPVKMFLFHCFKFRFHRPAYRAVIRRRIFADIPAHLADLVRGPALAQHVVHGILIKISQAAKGVKG